MHIQSPNTGEGVYQDKSDFINCSHVPASHWSGPDFCLQLVFKTHFNTNKCKTLHSILGSLLYFVISSSQRLLGNLGLNRPFLSILLYISVFIKDWGKEDNLFFCANQIVSETAHSQEIALEKSFWRSACSIRPSPSCARLVKKKRLGVYRFKNNIVFYFNIQ